MTQPDYPLAVLPSYELYQVAHIATFLADRLTRLRGATTKAERGAALDGLAAGRAALERALGATRPVALPEPIDAATFAHCAGADRDRSAVGGGGVAGPARAAGVGGDRTRARPGPGRRPHGRSRHG